MPPQRPISSRSLNGLALISVAGSRVIDLYPQLQAHLERFGLTGFLAEPRAEPGGAAGAGTIGWYSDLPGPAAPLDSLSGAARAAAEQRLAGMLRLLDAAADDARMGPLLRCALVTDGPAVMVVGDVPVLVNWGVAARRGGTGRGARAAALRAGLGRYHPRFAATTRNFFPRDLSVWERHWWALPVVLGVALGAMAGLAYLAAWPVPSDARSADIAALEQETRRGMREELGRLRAAAAEDACRADPALLPPRLTRPLDAAALPPAPAGGPPPAASLDELMARGIVMIVAESATTGKTLTGTGFLVTPTAVVTNAHVVAGAAADGIVVLRQKAAGVARATLRKATPRGPEGDDSVAPDLAVLDVAAVPQGVPLAITRAAGRRDQVLAAGFPGVAIELDARYQAILHGDETGGAPELVVTEGTIAALQTAASGLPLVLNTTKIAPGNSGGPLLDGCGRVVGVTTFGASTREGMPVVFSYAQKSDALLDFLAAAGIALTEATGPCPPVRPAPSPSPSPSPSLSPRRRRRRGRSA